MDSMAGYLKKTAEGVSLPKTAFEHGGYLIESEVKDEGKRDGMILKFSQLIDRHVQLANIPPEMLRFYQNDVGIHIDMLDMASREPYLAHVFVSRYFAWRGELIISKALKGKERDMQAAIGTSYQPAGSKYGFSAQEMADMQAQEEEQNLLQKILNFRGKQ